MKIEKLRSLCLHSLSNNLLIFFMLLSVNSCAAMSGHPQPTAIVVDADTGQPIEGAVAIATWREHSTKEAAWFEGGKMVPVRIEETLSDAQGKIYIDGFWDWHLFENRYPRLNIYMQGYVLWDQKLIHIPGHKSEQRQDFDKGNRIARLKKWTEKFSFTDHERFIHNVTNTDYHEATQKLFLRAIEYERPYAIKESTIENMRPKKLEKD